MKPVLSSLISLAFAAIFDGQTHKTGKRGSAGRGIYRRAATTPTRGLSPPPEVGISQNKLGFLRMAKKITRQLPEESEKSRLAVLESYGILDTSPETAFDSLVGLAAFVCQAPISLLSLMDEKRQWFKAKQGLDAQETDRNTSFCQHTLARKAFYEVPDALEHPLFAGHPIVVGIPQVRFYAGVPLLNTEGFALGTLCVLDTVPRKLMDEQKKALTVLAEQVMVNLELRKYRQLADKAYNKLVQGLQHASNQLLTIPDYRKAIGSALPTIGEALDVSRISVHEKVLAEGRNTCYRLQQWPDETEALPDQQGSSNEQVAQEGLGRWYNLLNKGEMVEGMRDAFPETEREILRIGGVKSVLVIPILLGRQCWGFIRFDECKQNRVWTPTEKHALSNLANTLGSAIARYQAEVALTNTKNYLDNIINAVPTPVFVKDRQHRFILINDAYCEMNGMSRERILGKSDHDLFAKADADLYREHEAVIFQSGKTQVYEETVLRPNHSTTTVITKKAAIKNQRGEDYLVGCQLDITDRLQAEKALVKEQALVRALMDYTPDYIYFKDLDSRFIRVSNSMLSRTDIEGARDLIGKTDFDIFSQEHARKAYEAEQQIIRTGSPMLNIEERETWPDGRVSWVSSTKMPLYGEDGKITGTFGISRNIATNKEAELALTNSRNYLNHIFDTVPVPIFVKDCHHRWVFLNESCCQFAGADKTFFMGKSDYDLHPREEADLFWERDDTVLRTGQETIHEEVLTNQNGLTRTVLTKKTRFRDQYGEDFLVGTLMDITTLKNTQTKLIGYQTYLNTLINAVTDPLFVKDSNYRLVLVNDSFCHLMGFSREHLLNKGDYELFPKEVADGFYHYDNIVFTSKSTSINEETIKDDRGVCRLVLTKKTYFTNELNESFLVGTVTDITENKMAEKKLQAYAVDLEKINKELDQFAYIVSHDLKAPLRAIANLSQWIEEDLGAGISGEVKANMELLRSRVNRLQALINGILDYSRLNRTKITYEEVNVGALLEEVIGVLDIPDTHPVTLQTAMPSIITNGIRLDQVFSNLIGNAFKYHDKPNGSIRISYQDNQDFHQFSVADDGPGIEPEYHEKIFVIFQTLQSKDKVESTGVGLAIVKKIIEDQGGNIGIASQPGHGSTFIFSLPKQTGNLTNKVDDDG